MRSVSPGVKWIDPPEEGEEIVLLEDGPFKGLNVSIRWGRSVLIFRDNEPHRCARYRPTRRRGVYRFRRWDQVLHRIELKA